MKLGVVANEFFDASIGRLGGFGWATRQLARFFTQHQELGVEVVFLSREMRSETNSESFSSHGVRLIPMRPSKLAYWKEIRREEIDVLLTIDYRPSYEGLFKMLPKTPIIIWMRDPRTREDASRLRTIRIPGQPDVVPQTAESFQVSLQKMEDYSKRKNRKLLISTTAPYLIHKVEDSYQVKPSHVSILPNIIDLNLSVIRKSIKPSVVFLGRLDPYKRPWIVIELAREFPEVDFYLCGKKHVSGPGSWTPSDIPDNVHLMGHTEGDEKLRLLSEAWVLINTSLHEGLAVSFQESLRCETPVLSSVDPQGIVSAFGYYVGYWEGTGLEALPKFKEGLQTLLENTKLREHLGSQGRIWVQNNHTPELFYSAFRSLCLEAQAKGAKHLGDFLE